MGVADPSGHRHERLSHHGRVGFGRRIRHSVICSDGLQSDPESTCASSCELDGHCGMKIELLLTRQYMLYQRLFEMDYNQHTGHYRLLDGAAPEVSPSRSSSPAVQTVTRVLLPSVTRLSLTCSDKTTNKPSLGASMSASTEQTCLSSRRRRGALAWRCIGSHGTMGAGFRMRACWPSVPRWAWSECKTCAQSGAGAMKRLYSSIQLDEHDSHHMMQITTMIQ